MDQPTTPRPGVPEAESLSVAVVEAIAERESIDPLDLDRPLYEVVDTEALEELFPVDGEGRPRSEGHVTFGYGGHRVRVSSDREVRILEPGTDGDDDVDSEDG